jgi:hypothetical protein
MDRRQLFQLLGATGTGFAIHGGLLHAAPHGGHEGSSLPVTPMTGPHAHFCGIHVAKNDPHLQLIAQHYCTAHAGQDHGEGLFQCLLFDSCEANAKLLGLEYIISHEQYQGLPDKEKKYWHPHTYEVLAGGLIAPEMSAEDEMKFMRQILTTWGKTWHTWPDPATAIPLGEPLLMWALSGDDQASEAVIRERDRRFDVSIKDIRRRRIQAIGYEVPAAPFPQSMSQVGRQWTAEGLDAPTPAQ